MASARKTPRRPASTRSRNGQRAPNATDSAGERQNRDRASTAERERRFVDEYFANALNVPKAMMAAGFSENYGTAVTHGSRMLRRPSVLKLIAAHRAKEGDHASERRERMVESLEAIAFGDVAQLFDDEGNLNKITRLDENTRKLIAGIEVNEVAIGENAMSTTRKVKIVDRLRAKELLAKLDGTLIEKHEHAGQIGVVEIVQFTKAPKKAKA